MEKILCHCKLQIQSIYDHCLWLLFLRTFCHCYLYFQHFVISFFFTFFLCNLLHTVWLYVKWKILIKTAKDFQRFFFVLLSIFFVFYFYCFVFYWTAQYSESSNEMTKKLTKNKQINTSLLALFCWKKKFHCSIIYMIIKIEIFIFIFTGSL